MSLSFRESEMENANNLSRLISFDGQSTSQTTVTDHNIDGHLLRTPKRSKFNSTSDSLLLTPSSTGHISLEPGSTTPVHKHLRTYASVTQKSPGCSGDRFIPNRAHMHMDLCRASIESAEKYRLAVIDRHASGLHSNLENRDPGQEHRATREELTPLQAEFRLRMRDALLNFDSGGMPANKVATALSTSSEINQTSANTNNIQSESSTNLVYADIAVIEEKYEDKGSRTLDCRTRMLSFRYESSMQLDISQQTQSASFSDLTPIKKHRNTSGPWFSSIDPFSHDQLHVLQRSSHSSALQQLNSKEDSGLISATKLIGRRINVAPTRILDAPELVDDYYLNLISWGRDNILAVALGQCVYLWNAASGEINHLLTLPGSDDYVTSVQWCDLERNSNYIAVGTNHGPVQV